VSCCNGVVVVAVVAVVGVVRVAVLCAVRVDVRVVVGGFVVGGSFGVVCGPERDLRSAVLHVLADHVERFDLPLCDCVIDGLMSN
jgi:TRAP-type mannitol/chloroaromatic compound transport system permease large subunit